MNFWEFVVELIHYAAWPVAIVIVFWWFRDEVKKLLQRISKIEGKGIKVDLMEKVLTSSAGINTGDGIFSVTEESLKYEDYQDLLLMTGVTFAATAAFFQNENKDTFEGSIERAFAIEDKLRKENYNPKMLDSLIKVNSALRLAKDKL